MTYLDHIRDGISHNVSNVPMKNMRFMEIYLLLNIV